MDGIPSWVYLLFVAGGGGWCPILVTAPEMQEEEVNYDIYSSYLVLQEILVTAPEIAREGG